MVCPGTVAQAPAAHERGRPSAVEVDRGVGTEVDQEIGELGEGQAGVFVAAAVDGDREHALTGKRQGGTGIAAGGDVGVELARAGREALGVLAVLYRPAAVADEERAGLEKVAGRMAGQLCAVRDPWASGYDVNASAKLAPRRIEGRVAASDPPSAQLAERLARGASEEPSDERVADAAGGAPHGKSLGLAQAGHLELRAPPVEGGDVDRGLGAVVERHPITGQPSGKPALLLWDGPGQPGASSHMNRVGSRGRAPVNVR